MTSAALEAGHNVTLLHRGKTNTTLFPKAEHLIGDRKQDIELANQNYWDVVFDTCGYFPSELEISCEFLKGIAKFYVFVSSVSTYDMENQSVPSLTESSPVIIDCEDPEVDQPATYGIRKALCEEIVLRHFPSNGLIVRPGLIVGPFDTTYRFPYWADRISEGGRILAPGDPKAPIQFIDARDLGEWMISCGERGIAGIYNATSPLNSLTMEEFLNEAVKALNPNAKLHWVSEKFLIEKKVSPWIEIPLWIPRDDNLILRTDSTKAIEDELSYREIGNTLRDTLEWSQKESTPEFRKKSLSRDREKALIEEFRSSQ